MARKTAAAAAGTASFDKASYKPGDKATLTVTRAKGSLDAQTIPYPGIPAVVAHADILYPPNAGPVAPDTHAYALQSDDGTTAVYTTTV